jgi:hypothetical protein
MVIGFPWKLGLHERAERMGFTNVTVRRGRMATSLEVKNVMVIAGNKWKKSVLFERCMRLDKLMMKSNRQARVFIPLFQ